MTAYGSPDLVYKKFGPSFDGPVQFAKRFAELEPGEHEIIVKINSILIKITDIFRIISFTPNNIVCIIIR